MEYIADISGSELATRVKLADLEHNMDLGRLGHEPTDKDLVRVEKYKRAYALLAESADKH